MNLLKQGIKKLLKSGWLYQSERWILHSEVLLCPLFALCRSLFLPLSAHPWLVRLWCSSIAALIIDRPNSHRTCALRPPACTLHFSPACLLYIMFISTGRQCEIIEISACRALGLLDYLFYKQRFSKAPRLNDLCQFVIMK